MDTVVAVASEACEDNGVPARLNGLSFCEG